MSNPTHPPPLTPSVADTLRSAGSRLPRSKYQRPEPYPFGIRNHLWKGEWREYYIDPATGKQKSRHRSKTWSRANFTKGEAQKALDLLVHSMGSIPLSAPSSAQSLSLADFWKLIYYPIKSRKWAPSSIDGISSIWRVHMLPKFGHLPLTSINKALIELHLGDLADQSYSESIVSSVLTRFHSVLEEAAENGYIPRNPVRKLEQMMPKCKTPPTPKSLSPAEVLKLWQSTEGRDYLVWRILLLTGSRIGELLALTRSDLIPAISGTLLRLDESTFNGHIGPTKNKKIRFAPLSTALVKEIKQWLSTHDSELMFPHKNGQILQRGYTEARKILARGAAIIPALTFRQCRTTFATLFDGDPKDVQEILGHHSLQFTMDKYKRPIEERQRRSVEGLESQILAASPKPKTRRRGIM